MNMLYSSFKPRSLGVDEKESVSASACVLLHIHKWHCMFSVHGGHMLWHNMYRRWLVVGKGFTIVWPTSQIAIEVSPTQSGLSILWEHKCLQVHSLADSRPYTIVCYYNTIRTHSKLMSLSGKLNSCTNSGCQALFPFPKQPVYKVSSAPTV